MYILVSVNYRKKNSQHKIRIGEESLLIPFWSTLCSVYHISMVPTFMVSLFSSLFSFLKKLLLEHSFQTLSNRHQITVIVTALILHIVIYLRTTGLKGLLTRFPLALTAHRKHLNIHFIRCDIKLNNNENFKTFVDFFNSSLSNFPHHKHFIKYDEWWSWSCCHNDKERLLLMLGRKRAV